MNIRKIANITDNGDEVLVAFAQAGADADLTEWTRRHPEYARELARAAADRWCVEGAMDKDPIVVDAAAEARLRNAGLAALRALRGAAPMTSLLSAAEAKDLDIDALAARLSLTEAYVVKLHRRLFAPDSLPRTLVQNLAEALGRATSEVNAYLAGPPRLAMGASYRSDSAPSVGEREDFRATLGCDPELTAAQRALYLDADNTAA